MCVLVGAKMIELGMDMVVAESVPVGTRDAGASEEVDVVSGAEVVVLASTVVEGCVEIGSLVTGSLLAADVDVDVDDASEEEIGKVDDVMMGTRPVPVSVAELLLGAYVMGVSSLLELNDNVAPVVRGAVGVMISPEDVLTVPFDGTVEDVSTGTGTTETPEVLREYEPVDIPVPVRVAVAVALDDASEDAALESIPENSEDSDEDTAGCVATMLES